MPMPRTARQLSATGVYHVFLRGINRQAIFEGDDDFQRFVAVIRKCRERSSFELYGFCLLDNHVHLLLKAGEEGISQAVKRIAIGYATWYNWKYERTGHLFQDRFASEPVEHDNYLLAALRYIHQNPVRAGICRFPEQYERSSYRDYLGYGPGLTDIDFIKGLATDYSRDWRGWLKGFTNAESEDSFIDCEIRPRLSDSMLRARINDLYAMRNATDISALDKATRDSIISSLKEEGFGLRQLSRVTGVPLGIVRSR